MKLSGLPACYDAGPSRDDTCVHQDIPSGLPSIGLSSLCESVWPAAWLPPGHTTAAHLHMKSEGPAAKGLRRCIVTDLASVLTPQMPFCLSMSYSASCRRLSRSVQAGWQISSGAKHPHALLTWGSCPPSFPPTAWHTGCHAPGMLFTIDLQVSPPRPAARLPQAYLCPTGHLRRAQWRQLHCQRHRKSRPSRVQPCRP